MWHNSTMAVIHTIFFGLVIYKNSEISRSIEKLSNTKKIAAKLLCIMYIFETCLHHCPLPFLSMRLFSTIVFLI